ncbi:uncharacterized protein LOC131219947 [Magnolia sinica]|uniref:uncharacterized protein LOC131219947 n=1 Tax=Magnolia sinica TaxID=86752 RepID=UPI0026598659|nr:uncharacterized protein LOC131219947 [Magnolia sinica]
MRAVVSTYHLMMKFPAEGGTGYLQGHQCEIWKCYAIVVKKGSVKQALTINVLDPRGLTKDSSVEDLEAMPLDEADPSKTVQLGTSLNSKQRYEILAFLQQHRNVFTWSYEGMLGISPDVMVHRLNVEPDHRPVKQKRRPFDAERYEAITDEVFKLLSIGFIEGMKLNPAKYAFRVCSGKFLGFQKLKGHKKAEWTSKCEQAFQQLEQYFGSPPLLSKPKEGEPLFLYFSVSASAVSSALIEELVCKQHPVYYVSKAMVPAETRYPALEKLTLCLVISARRLSAYFQAHSIIVLTDSPLRQVLQKPEVSSRLTKWAIELGEFDIQFRSRTAIKSQVVADFIAKFIAPSEEGISIKVEAAPSPIPPINQETVSKPGWILYVYESSNVKRAGAGIVLVTPDSTSIQYVIRLGFKASNNEAEYEALLARLRLAASLGVQSLEVRYDSQLVVNHISTEYEAKKTRMVAYLAEARKLIKRFWSCTINQIPRAENSWADTLAKLASAMEGKIPRVIPMEFIEHPSIDQIEKKITNPVEVTPSWMNPIYNYLTSGEVPSNRLEARRLRVRVARYIVLDGILYKKGHS